MWSENSGAARDAIGRKIDWKWKPAGLLLVWYTLVAGWYTNYVVWYGMVRHSGLLVAMVWLCEPRISYTYQIYEERQPAILRGTDDIEALVEH